MKIAGLGLINIMVLWVIFVVLTVGMKTILNKYPVKGATELINAV